MAQPVIMYDKDGKEVITTSPNVTKDRVAAGELFYNPPAVKGQKKAEE